MKFDRFAAAPIEEEAGIERHQATTSAAKAPGAGLDYIAASWRRFAFLTGQRGRPNVAKPLPGDPDLADHLGPVRSGSAFPPLTEPHRERLTR